MKHTNKRDSRKKSTRSIIEYEESAYLSDEVRYVPDELSYLSDEVSYTPDDLSYLSDEISYSPDDFSILSDDVSYTSDELSYLSSDTSYIPDELMQSIDALIGNDNSTALLETDDYSSYEDDTYINTEDVLADEEITAVTETTTASDVEQSLFESIFKPQDLPKNLPQNLPDDRSHDTPNSTPQSISQKSARQQEPVDYVYPETTLTRKQLEAIQSVIQTAPIDPPDPDIDIDVDVDTKTSKKASKKANKKHTEFEELKIKDRSIIKTVLFVVFMVLILCAAGLAGFYYYWTEHADFDFTLQPVVILEGQSVTPEDFLTSGDDMEGVTAVFQDPDFEPFVGMQFVQLTLKLGLRTTEGAAPLYVLTPIESRRHEFAEVGTTLRAIEFLINPEIAANVSFTIEFVEQPLPLSEYPVGEHILRLSLNGAPFEAKLIVDDTTLPIAITNDVTIFIGEQVTPGDFFETPPFDASGIKSVTFIEEPDVFARVQEQPVSIRVEDNNGNIAEFFATLYTTLHQFEPTLIVPYHLIESQAGKAVNYRLEDAFANDEFGNLLEVFVNDDDVNVDVPGEYTAIIWTEDLSGLRSEVEVIIHIINTDPEAFTNEIRQILFGTDGSGGIINNTMTPTQQALRIHDWIRTRTTHTRDRDSGLQSLTDEAKRTLDERRGNSRAYASLSSFMLTQAGIENMMVERVSTAPTSHHWLVIHIEGEGWFHFDPFPTGLVLGNLTAKFNQKEATDLTQRIRNLPSGIVSYYIFDPTDIPPIVPG